MVLNVAIDAVVGAIPVLGSVFDFVFKANTRNVALLSDHIDDAQATRLRSAQGIRRTLIGAAVGLLAVLVLLSVLVVWLLTLVF